MKSVDVLLVGAGGYGSIYLSFFRNGWMEQENAHLVGIVDPFVKAAGDYDWIVEQKIPVYDTMDAFFAEHSANLTLIAAPHPTHAGYCISAMEHGSDVLCEKPLTPTVEQMDALEETRKRLGKMLAVGFQWSFCNTMNTLKKDILAGVYGKPKKMKTFISAPRMYAYYRNSTWKGRVKNDRGEYVMDSVVTNATAHYLHNMLFMLGDSMTTAAYPETLRAEVYRAKDIESFDTCTLKATVAGIPVMYVTSHATDHRTGPEFIYEFEKGRVIFGEATDRCVIGQLDDGRTIEYGHPFAKEEDFQKCKAMIRYVQDGTPPVCTIPTTRPHLVLCNGIFKYCTFNDFPAERLEEVDMDDPVKANRRCKGLYEDLRACYEEELLPSEKGYSWSRPATDISLDEWR